MGKIFNMDSPIMRFMTKVADIMILNLLFILTSLPIITIGAAWSSLYYVSMKLVRDEEGGIVHSFFHSFRMNFRQATILWLGTVAVFAVLIADLLILAQIDSPYAAAMNTSVLILGVVLLMILQYLFPLVAKFDATMKQTLKNACLMSVAHLPKTILMTAFVAGSAFISFFNGYTLPVASVIFAFIGFGLIAFGNSAILVKIFDQYIPKEESHS
jgi:uncharacterized membrane protein YesL